MVTPPQRGQTEPTQRPEQTEPTQRPEQTEPTQRPEQTEPGEGTPSRPLVVLIGPPGAGKTTVGAALAERLGVPLRDTDLAIEEREGCSVSDIFLDRGEAAFRALERDELAAALTEHRGVLAVGGGAVMDDSSRQALTELSRLARLTVVYLQVGIADAAKRVGFDRSRPMMAINPRGQWVRLLELRKATYEGLAALTVTTGERTPGDVADEIVQRLGDLA